MTSCYSPWLCISRNISLEKYSFIGEITSICNLHIYYLLDAVFWLILKIGHVVLPLWSLLFSLGV